jgi:hypothetical protein
VFSQGAEGLKKYEKAVFGGRGKTVCVLFTFGRKFFLKIQGVMKGLFTESTQRVDFRGSVKVFAYFF